MPRILHQLPITAVGDLVFVGQEMARVKAFQIIAWASITAGEVLDLPHALHRFPVIVDTGHTHNFSIQEQHLGRWAGLRRESLHRLGATREGERRVPLYAAHLWIHPNRPGRRDEFVDEPPYRLLMEQGIAVFPDEENHPRLPLLGLRALLFNKLHFTVDGKRKQVFLRTQKKWWFFG